MVNRNNAYLLGSLHRALKILCSFSYNHSEWGVTELATRLGMNKSTVHRILMTMETHGVVEKKGNHRYTLGLRIFELGNLYHLENDVAAMAQLAMQKLAKQVKLNVSLGKLEGGKVYYFLRVDSPGPVQIQITPLSGCEAAGSAIGKVFLSSYSQQALKDFVQTHGLPRKTGGTPMKFDQLKDDLNKLCQRGYALGDQGFSDLLRAIAAPVYDDAGRLICALNVTGTLQQLPLKRVPEIAEKVRYFASKLSHQLGYVAEGR